MSQYCQLLLIMNSRERLKIFLMLKIIKVESNIGFNKLAEMKTGNSMIFLDLMIFQKLATNPMIVIQISCNLKQKKMKEKKNYLKDYSSK